MTMLYPIVLEIEESGAVSAYVQAMRLRNTVGEETTYRYQEDVENFFRHSPAVIRDRPAQ